MRSYDEGIYLELINTREESSVRLIGGGRYRDIKKKLILHSNTKRSITLDICNKLLLPRDKNREIFMKIEA